MGTVKPNIDRDIPVTLAWVDNFDTLDNWEQEFSSKHRTRSKYLDPVTGEIDYDQPWNKVDMRYSTLYTPEYRDRCQFIRNGNLIMKGFAVETPARYRDNFVDAQDDTLVHRYGDFEIHGGWLESMARLSPGSILQTRLTLSRQCMREHRFSIWLVSDDGKMYGESVYHCEIDILEALRSRRLPDHPFNNHGLMKVVGGDAGDTPGGEVNFDDYGIDIHDGWHDVTLVWNLDGSLEFYVDGILCNTDDRTQFDPPDGVFMSAQIILSDEMCSGVKGKDASDWENRTTGPRNPESAGLTGNSAVLDIDLIDEHEVEVESMVCWRMAETKTSDVDSEVDLLRAENNRLKAENQDLKITLDRVSSAIKFLTDL